MSIITWLPDESKCAMNDNVRAMMSEWFKRRIIKYICVFYETMDHMHNQDVSISVRTVP